MGLNDEISTRLVLNRPGHGLQHSDSAGYYERKLLIPIGLHPFNLIKGLWLQNRSIKGIFTFQKYITFVGTNYEIHDKGITTGTSSRVLYVYYIYCTNF